MRAGAPLPFEQITFGTVRIGSAKTDKVTPAKMRASRQSNFNMKLLYTSMSKSA